jgi:ATP:ADP antiporter, AAA family
VAASVPMASRRSPVETALSIVSDVRPGEGVTGVALLASVFLLLASNYLLKPARDGLLAVSGIPGLSSMELKAYASFFQGVILIAIMPLYARLASTLDRLRLVTRIGLFCVADLVVFWLLQPGLIVGRMPLLGIAFYLWAGLFNVFVVAQFWAFAADLYGDEGGRRLFPVIAIGAGAGATAGAWIAKELATLPGFGTYSLLLLAALCVTGSLSLMRLADRRGPGGRAAPAEQPPAPRPCRRPGRRFLIAVGIVILLFSWVKTNSDNLLFAVVQEVIHDEVVRRQLGNPDAADAFIRNGTTAFYGDLAFWTSLAALLVQMLATSRILRRGGFAAILLALPVLAAASNVVLALAPLLWLFRLAKIAQDAAAYSVNDTAFQVLWLPTDRHTKFKAKTAVDTLCVRLGDGMAALTALAGMQVLMLTVPAFFALNAMLVALWLGAAAIVVQQYRWMQHGGLVNG